MPASAVGDAGPVSVLTLDLGHGSASGFRQRGCLCLVRCWAGDLLRGVAADRLSNARSTYRQHCDCGSDDNDFRLSFIGPSSFGFVSLTF
jgi:hypothetical protein